MIHNKFRYILTLVALFAMTAGAWADDFYLVVDGTSATVKYGDKGSNPYYGDDPMLPGNYGWLVGGSPYYDKSSLTTVTIDASCQNYTGTTLESFFDSWEALTTINNLENLNTSEVTNMSDMFSACISLTSFDLSGWNTAKVTNMGYMFFGLPVETLDLSGFNTSSVTLMSGMFYYCQNLKNIYVGDGWSTASVTDGTSMFEVCTSLPGYDANKIDHAMAKLTTDGGYLKVKPITVTWNAATKTGTFTMPGSDVVLTPVFYPGMLTLPASLTGGTLEVVGLTGPFTKLEVLDAWKDDNTLLSATHLPGLKEMTDDAAQKWEGAPKEGLASLIYGFEGTKAKTADYVGGIFALSGTQDLTLSTVKTASADAEIYYSSEAQMPAGFETDGKNIYVADKTEFQVKAVPAKGYRLVSLMFGETDVTDQVDADGIATLTMPEGNADITLTATFSNEYDLTLNAANANTIDATQASKGTVTVKVGTAAAVDKTGDITDEGKLEAIKMGSEVKLNANNGYKFRKVEVKKGGPGPLTYATKEGAVTRIKFNYSGNVYYADFTYSNGSFTRTGGTEGYGFSGSWTMKEENGVLTMTANYNEMNTQWIYFVCTFYVDTNEYTVSNTGSWNYSFRGIEVNGNDITDQLTKVK